MTGWRKPPLDIDWHHRLVTLIIYNIWWQNITDLIYTIGMLAVDGSILVLLVYCQLKCQIMVDIFYYWFVPFLYSSRTLHYLAFSLLDKVRHLLGVLSYIFIWIIKRVFKYIFCKVAWVGCGRIHIARVVFTYVQYVCFLI